MKRGQNEGTIYRKANGKWRAQVSIDGRRLSKTAPTRREVATWLRETLNRIDNGLTYDSVQTTLGEFLSAWLDQKKTHLRGSTYEQYRRYARLHIIPELGHVKFKDLAPGRIQRFLDDLEATSRVTQITHAILRACLNQAVRIGLLSSNPASLVIVPKEPRREMRFYTDTEVSQFLIHAIGSRNEHLYYMAMAIGMRQGELLALQWNDLDWARETAKVQRQVFMPEGGGFKFIPPKTRRGTRVVDLGPQTMERLRNQIDRVQQMRLTAGDRWREHDLVFPTTVGTPQFRWEVTRDFQALAKEAGLPKIRFHDLRHTAATLMLNHGVPLLIVSRRLGHAKPSVTLDLYGHVIPGMQREAAQMIDDLITPVQLHPVAPDNQEKS